MLKEKRAMFSSNESLDECNEVLDSMSYVNRKKTYACGKYI